MFPPQALKPTAMYGPASFVKNAPKIVVIKSMHFQSSPPDLKTHSVLVFFKVLIGVLLTFSQCSMLILFLGLMMVPQLGHSWPTWFAKLFQNTAISQPIFGSRDKISKSYAKVNRTANDFPTIGQPKTAHMCSSRIINTKSAFFFVINHHIICYKGT